MFRQLFPTLYFCPFFLMISKYRKIFLTTFIRTMFLSMIFILSCWSFHIPLHVWHIVFFCFFIQYLHIKSTSSFSFKQGTPQHVLHRSQGRNQKWTKRKEQWKDTVHPVIGITNQHMKKKPQKRSQTWHKVCSSKIRTQVWKANSKHQPSPFRQKWPKRFQFYSYKKKI